MSEHLSFQDTILRLLDYWKELGCIVQQPYNVQVGAGTMNPATSLRVLGPEPWNVVYVEPSVRPDDGRFGENPNRLQMHHQLQVILKPDPGNPQELYLKSLEAIGIDPRQHDIRFVEDNWESPALGAWGLGWEVWLDGQEITQFTYFQQAGSLNLEPVCVEITYGLDRIILALQNKKSVYDIDYAITDKGNISYGNVLLQAEIEHCEYYFNVADVDALRAVYDTYETEANRCIEANLVVPAHDFNLKCSHLFNVMDTRGAIGVTERANYFKRMRGIARQISQLYVEQRQRLEYPFLETEWQLNQTIEAVADGASVADSGQSGPQTFVLEIGQEELPAHDLDSATRQLRLLVSEMLDDARLTYTSLEIDGTPRRLAVIIGGLAERQPDVELDAKGPPAERAFDADGNPTKAAIGFAKGKGIDVGDLKIIEEGDKKYVMAHVKEIGKDAEEVLAEALPTLVSRIKFNKSMRWNHTNIAYSRPLRWFVALYGANVVPFEYAGIASGRVSRGLRPYNSPPIVIGHASGYVAQLQTNSIMLNTEQRMSTIVDKANALADSLGGSIPEDAGLLDEVTHLVENPVPFIGSFDEKYLDLPAEILVAVMRKHQRYFPVYSKTDGSLLPNFIAVRNGDEEHLDIVRDGNEQVIRARFADGEFFYGNDKDTVVADFVPELAKLTFQTELGSMLDKTKRLEALTPEVAEMIGTPVEAKKVASRAASLAKADLASNMVVEMTSLQGIMGGEYAKMSGESEAVAEAIAEQYNGISKTEAGLPLALADRLDSLVGLTAAGLLPKGSNDPFALRRAAIQVLENVITNKVDIDLRKAIDASASHQPIEVTDEHKRSVYDFLLGRLEVLLREDGFGASAVKAVLAEQAHNPYRANLTVAELSEAIASEGWETVLDAYARCVRITRKLDETHTASSERFVTAEGSALFGASEQAVSKKDGSFATLLASLRDLEPSITTFFDKVLVMDEDLGVRNNRLGLLQEIARLADGIADLSLLEGF